MEQIVAPRKLQEPQDLNKRDLKKEDRVAPDLFAATLSMHLRPTEQPPTSDGPSEQRGLGRPEKELNRELPKKMDDRSLQAPDDQRVGESHALEQPELPDALKEAAEALQSYIQDEVAQREPRQTTSTQTELLFGVRPIEPPGQSSLGLASELPLSEPAALVEPTPAEPLVSTLGVDEAHAPVDMTAEEAPAPDAALESEEVVEVVPETPERISTHDELEATFSLQEVGAGETAEQDLGSGAQQSSSDSSGSSGWEQPDAPAISLGQTFQGELKSAQQTTKQARALAQEMVTRVLEANSKNRLMNKRLSIAIPMEGGDAVRLVLTPGNAGEHKLALVSASASQREQLKRALPELESAAAELPLTISEILVDSHEASHPIEPSAHARVEAVRRHPE